MVNVKQIFGMKPTPIQKFVQPERQSIEQTEDYAVKKVINTKEGTIEKTPVNDNDIVNKAYADSLGGAPEGTAVKSTGEAGGTKFLREDGDGTSSWQTATTPPYKRWIKPILWQVSAGSQAVGTAGRVFLQLTQVEEDCVVDSVVISNVATVAGNVTVGIYGPVDTEGTPLNSPLLANSNSTVCAGVSIAQIVPLTSSTPLIKGMYYIAIEYSDATHTYYNFSYSAHTNLIPGCSYRYDRGGGYGALTDPVPAVTATSSCPSMVLRCVI